MPLNANRLARVAAGRRESVGFGEVVDCFGWVALGDACTGSFATDQEPLIVGAAAGGSAAALEALVHLALGHQQHAMRAGAQPRGGVIGLLRALEETPMAEV